jgi:hypothetical protein
LSVQPAFLAFLTFAAGTAASVIATDFSVAKGEACGTLAVLAGLALSTHSTASIAAVIATDFSVATGGAYAAATLVFSREVGRTEGADVVATIIELPAGVVAVALAATYKISALAFATSSGSRI